MINSLYKDSHMGPRFCPPILYSGRGAYKTEGNSVTKNKQCLSVANNDDRISVNKPAEVNFCGFSSSRLANDDIFKELIIKTRVLLGHEELPDTKNIFQRVKNFFVETKRHKQLMDLINNVILSHMNEDVTISKEAKKNLGINQDKLQEYLNSNKDIVKRFLDSQRDLFLNVIKRAQQILAEEHDKDPIKPEHMPRKTKNAINTAVNAYPTVEKPGKIYNSKTLRNFFIMADNSQSVFGAFFALILTGLFRPATIMVLPGQKKNKDDKKYAAAHSVASGLIGYAIALVISSPIASAMKKLEKEPEKFLTKDAVEYLRHKKPVNTAKLYVNMLHEAILAFPRAAITIALIPPILKHVFGYESKKNKSVADHTRVVQNFAATKTVTSKVFKDFNGGNEK